MAPGGGTGSTGGPNAQAFCERYLKEVCAKLTGCGEYQEAANCERIFSAFDACSRAATPGVEFSASQAEVDACFSAVASDTSCALGTTFPACNSLNRPTVARGGSCSFSLQCQPSDACSASAAQCPGQCRERVALGESVTDERPECVAGAFAAQNKVCTAQIATGAACPMVVQKGAPCQDINANCVDGMCQLKATPGKAGDACEGFQQTCRQGLQCLNLKCAPLRGLGESCQTEFGGSRCKSDLFCNNGTCAAQVGEGQPCSIARFECAAGLVCGTTPGDAGFSVNGFCTKIKSIGGACVTSIECESSTAFCKDRVCTAKLEIGASCEGFEVGACKPGALCDQNTKKCERSACIP
jgi:hypothetical protein